MAVGIGVGSGYLFETDSKKEVYSDLTDERGVLMEALAGIIEAQTKYCASAATRSPKPSTKPWKS